MATVTISGEVRDSTERNDNRPWYVRAASYQDGGDGGTVTPRKSRAIYPNAGTLTFEVEADIALAIENPDGDVYLVTTPSTDDDLWSLIAASVLIPPGTTQEALEAAVGTYFDGTAGEVGLSVLLSESQEAARTAIDTYSTTEADASASAAAGTALTTATGRAIAFAIALG